MLIGTKSDDFKEMSADEQKATTTNVCSCLFVCVSFCVVLVVSVVLCLVFLLVRLVIVSFTQAIRVANAMHAPLVFCSAKEGINVQKIFKVWFVCVCCLCVSCVLRRCVSACFHSCCCLVCAGQSVRFAN